MTVKHTAHQRRRASRIAAGCALVVPSLVLGTGIPTAAADDLPTAQMDNLRLDGTTAFVTFTDYTDGETGYYITVFECDNRDRIVVDQAEVTAVPGTRRQATRQVTVPDGAGGPQASYTGVVGDDYHMSGATGTVKYRSVFPISCLTLADPPPPQPPAEGPIPADPVTPPKPQGPRSMTKSVIVNGDVEVYDVPGGDGRVIGELEGGEGQTVGLHSCKPDNWCNVTFASGPDGRGWVWGAFLDRPGA